MLPCASAEKVRMHYEKLMAWINEAVKNFYRKWVETLNDDINLYLSQPLMCRSTSHIGLIECNLPR